MAHLPLVRPILSETAVSQVYTWLIPSGRRNVMALPGRLLVSLPFIPALALMALARCTPGHSDSKPPAIGVPINPLIWCTGTCNAGIVLEVRDARTGLPAATGTRVEI